MSLKTLSWQAPYRCLAEDLDLNLDPGHIRQRLLPTTPPHLNSKLPHAAVLVLLFPGSAGPAILLTRRSLELPLHAGQICCPGGRVHSGDGDLEATALREANEETGLERGLVQVLGRLPGTVVSSGIHITPVVAWMDSAPKLLAAPREVVELIEFPLSIALDLSAYKRDSIVSNEIRREFYFIEFNGYYVWGATARILRSLAQALGGPEAG